MTIGAARPIVRAAAYKDFERCRAFVLVPIGTAVHPVRPSPPGRAAHRAGRRRTASGRPYSPPVTNARWSARPIDSRIGSSRSEEHTSELQSLMRNSYAGFCLHKKKNIPQHIDIQYNT